MSFDRLIVHSVADSPSKSHARPLPTIPATGALDAASQKTGSRGAATYSFLASDPAQMSAGAVALSRRSSRASVSSTRSKANSPLPPLPGTPSSSPFGLSSARGPPSTYEEHEYPTSPRESGMYLEWAHGRPISKYSGMADVNPTPSLPPSTFGHPQSNPSPEYPLSPTSPTSAMGEQPTRSARSSISSAVRALSSRTKSRAGQSQRSKSVRSTKSTKSTHSKRGSTSTVGHRFGNKRWDWDTQVVTAPVMVEADELEWLSAAKQNEEMMDLLALVGRATVLERMLKKGKRVSLIRTHTENR